MSLDWLIMGAGGKAHTLTFERATITKDSSAGTVRTWATISGPFYASIQPLSVTDQNRYAQRQLYVDHEVYFNQEPSLKRGDRAYDETGLYYLVEGFWQEVMMDRLWVVLLKLQTN